MDTIKRDVYVLRDTLKSQIQVSDGTNAVTIEFTVRDFNIPASAAAVVYSLGQRMATPNKLLADISGNTISFTPTEGFFAAGLNALQIRVIDGNKKLISFQETVKCSGKLKFDDETEAQQSTLIEQLLAKMGSVENKAETEIKSLDNKKADKTDLTSQIATMDNKKADKTDLTSPFNYKGTCLSTALPTSGNKVNDTYFCTDLQYRMSWNGSGWFQSSLDEAKYQENLNALAAVDSKLKSDLGGVDSRLSESINEMRDKEANLLSYKDNSWVSQNNAVEVGLTNDGITVTAIKSGAYLYAYQIIDVTKYTTITVNVDSFNGTGQRRINIGNYDTGAISWIANTNNTQLVVDVSNIGQIVIALYATFNTQATAGASVFYGNVRVEIGNTRGKFFMASAYDAISRYAVDTLTDRVNIDDNIGFDYELGNIDNNGKNIASSSFVRSCNYLFLKKGSKIVNNGSFPMTVYAYERVSNGLLEIVKVNSYECQKDVFVRVKVETDTIALVDIRINGSSKKISDYVNESMTMKDRMGLVSANIKPDGSITYEASFSPNSRITSHSIITATEDLFITSRSWDKCKISIVYYDENGIVISHTPPGTYPLIIKRGERFRVLVYLKTIDESKNNFSMLYNALVVKKYEHGEEYKLTYENGSYYNTTDGSFNYNYVNNRIAHYEFVKSVNGLHLSVDKQYSFWVLYFDKNFVLTETIEYSSTSGIDVDPSKGVYFKIALKNADDSNINADDCADVIKFDFGNNVPDYYTSYLGQRIDEIETYIEGCSSGTDTFIFLTDTHWSMNARKSPSLIKILGKITSKVVFGGDAIMLGTHDAMKYDIKDFVHSLKQTGLDVYPVFGNHDDNHLGYGQSPTFSDGEIYSWLFRPFEMNVHGVAGKRYYYFDNTSIKLRYIVLDSEQWDSYDEEQVEWLGSVLKNSDDYTVVVISHMMYGGMKPNENIPYSPNGMYKCYAMIKAFKNKRTYESYNFNDSTGNLAYILQGHSHQDWALVDDGVNVIATTCDKNINDNGTGVYEGREDGTINEQAFDVCVTDVVSRTIKTFRIGYGNDRDFTY